MSGGPTAGLVAVPDLFEMSATKAAKVVEAAGLVPKFTGDNAKNCWVYIQSPVARQLVVERSTVTILLHKGPLP